MKCRLEVALSGGPWAMLRAPGPGPAAYDVRGRFAADAPRANFGVASRALTLRDVASACHKCVSVACCHSGSRFHGLATESSNCALQSWRCDSHVGIMEVSSCQVASCEPSAFAQQPICKGLVK